MSKEDLFDEKVGESLSAWGQRVSRRGLLARIGKVLMWVGGVSVAAPLLPLNRVAAQGGCGDWRLCGIYGNLCAPCCGGAASLTVCPSCTTRGSGWWEKCCQDNSSCPPLRRMIRYYDCCGNTSQSNACQGLECYNNTTQPAWCNEGLSYRCTVVSIGAAC